MARSNLITGLDIGSHSIRVVVGQLVDRGPREQPHIIATVEVSSEGISRGVVKSLDDAVSSISVALERAEKITGAPISNVYLAIAGAQILSLESKGVVGISRSDGEITEQDVERAIEASRTFATPSNYDILHVIPRSFNVDGEANIKDPVGMQGIRLEVSAYIIQTLSSQMKNLTKCVYRAGVEIDDLVLGVLSAAEATLTSRAKELGVVLINIGASHTSFVIYEAGDLVYAGILPIGGEHITSDIAIGLRTSFEVAEELKLRYGVASARDVSRKTEVNLRELGSVDDEVINLKSVAEIIEARVEEIFVSVDQTLRKLGKSGRLPAGAVLVGGTANLPGLIDVAKHKLGLPALTGFPLGISSVSDKIADPAFATSLGLIKWGALSYTSSASSFRSILNNVAGAGALFKQVKGFFNLFRK